MASALLDLHVTTTAGYTLVEVGGEIDVASAPELRDCLNQTIDAGSRQLVVDLRQVSFIDSESLGVLVGARRRLLRYGHDGGIQLVCANGLVLRILRISGLARVFPLHASGLGGDTTALLHDQLDPIRDHLGGVRPLSRGPRGAVAGPLSRYRT